MHNHIPFNKPHLTGNEVNYIKDAVDSGKISGNGKYTQLCQSFMEKKYGFKKCLLTTSCTDALEMAALLLDIQPGDEVISPSYTFVSTCNPFLLRGAIIKFVDSEKHSPNMDVNKIEELINSKTKAIVVVHYAGVALDMDKVMSIANKHNLFVVEDAAQAIDSYYNNKPLGSFGNLAAFSFHETKNIISGEGGMLVINDNKLEKRAEILWEKGTNRTAFYRGEIDKYGWVDIGSSFLPSELTAAFLYAQFENLKSIQTKRFKDWNTYFMAFQEIKNQQKVELPIIPEYSNHNAHIFYLILSNPKYKRDDLIMHLKNENIHSVFHYQSLHKSSYYLKKHSYVELPHCDSYSDNLLRLPLYYDLKEEEIQRIINSVNIFFNL